ncbi:MAG: hypothetical protein ABFE07_28305 [Armatimonadia bacterium]
MDEQTEHLGKVLRAIEQIDEERSCCTCFPEVGRTCIIHRITGLILRPNPHAGTEPGLSSLYMELLYAVERKFPEETRHQTALRYIREAEQRGAAAVGQAAPRPAEEA